VPPVRQTAETLSLKEELVLKLKYLSKNSFIGNSKLKITTRMISDEKTHDTFLGGFGELWNQTSDFIMFVCPSVSPH
jgi:hypothetical protein